MYCTRQGNSYPSPDPPTTQLPCTPLWGTLHLGLRWGGKEKRGPGRRASPCSLSGQLLSERVGWTKVFLLPYPLVITGKQASNSWPLALLACWQAASAGKRREGEREGGSEAAGAQPYLDGRFLAGLLGFSSFQPPPFFSFFSFCPWCGSLPPLSPPVHPNRLLQARETRDSVGKG